MIVTMKQIVTQKIENVEGVIFTPYLLVHFTPSKVNLNIDINLDSFVHRQRPDA